MSMFVGEVIGYLGRDPEMRFTPDGDPVANFNVAANNYRKDTVWVRVSVFGKQAEAVNQYLKKGSQVYVRGDVQFDPETSGPRLYQRNDGTWAASFEIRAHFGGVQFLSGQGGNGQASSSPQPVEEEEEEEELEDLPF